MHTVGDFTFWISAWLRLMDEPKTRLSWRWSQKVKSNLSFGLSYGSVRTFGSVWLEPFGLGQSSD